MDMSYITQAAGGSGGAAPSASGPGSGLSTAGNPLSALMTSLGAGVNPGAEVDDWVTKFGEDNFPLATIGRNQENINRRLA